LVSFAAGCARAPKYEKLHEAVKAGDVEDVRTHLRRGADLKPGHLRAAADAGHTEVVRVLLEAGADVNAAPVTGSTALHAAAEKGYDDVAQLLLEAGANANAEASGPHQTPLFGAAREGQVEVVVLLLAAGAEPDPAVRAGSFGEPPSPLYCCLLYTSPSPRDRTRSRMPSSA